MLFLMRVKYKQLGGHTHVTFFAGHGEKMVEERFSGLGNSGTLIFRNEEWAKFKSILEQPRVAQNGDCVIELVEEKDEPYELAGPLQLEDEPDPTPIPTLDDDIPF